MEGLCTSLQADLRQLIADSRKVEGISGFFSAQDNPAIKEAAERAILKVRSFAGPQALARIRDSKDILRPFLIACDTKNTKLGITALGCVQKLLANDAVAPERADSILTALKQVEKLSDEGAQLKVLQTALTLLQSSSQVDNEEVVGVTLGLCFRLLSNTRNGHSVRSTAGATARQGVAVVYERLESSCAPPGVADTPPDGVVRIRAAGEKLLLDICEVLRGRVGKWLNVQQLPRSFILDLLDFVLANHKKMFHTLPAFRTLLQEEICPFVCRHLSDTFTVDSATAADSAETKQLLRLASTILLHLHSAVPAGAGALVLVLLKGASTSATLWQRTQTLKVFHQLCHDPRLLLFLFEHHDFESSESRVVREVVECFAETASSYVSLMGHDDHELSFLAGLYAQKAAAGMHTDSFHESSISISVGTAEEAGALLAMLAIDCMLAITSAMDLLADQTLLTKDADDAPTTQEATPDHGSRQTQRLTVYAQLVDSNWKPILAILYEILSRANGEALVLELVKGYQRMIQTTGALGACGDALPELARDRATKARDGFLSSLCEFTLTAEDPRIAAQAAAGMEPTPAQPNNPTLKEAITGRFHRSTSGSISAGNSGRDAYPAQPPADVDARVLTQKNVQCMRALFNCAYRLCSSLGTSWAIVLSNLVSLDRILQSPHTTTKEISSQTDVSGRLSADLSILQAAANQLFESTAYLSTEAVLSMMASLRDISTRTLSADAQRPTTVRLIALERLVEMLLVNSHRVQDLWGVFLTHIMEVVNTVGGPNRNMPVQVRLAGMEALDRATTGVLVATAVSHTGSAASAIFQRPSGSSFSPTKAQGGCPEKDSMAIERMVLLPLEELYKQARDMDVRLGVLRIVMHCLQRNGEHLTTGWQPILRLLREVPTRDEPDTLALAFQSVQLLSSEYMPGLSEEMQIGCIQVVTLYGSQTTDMNISLTAIGLLWNTADLLVSSLSTKVPSVLDSTDESAPAEEGVGGGSEQPPGDSVQEDLLQSLLSALQRLSGDVRPEVRNSAVKTLFAVMASTGVRLAPKTWETCLWGLLFPLLEQTFHMAATSSRDENEAAELGKDRGKSVKMLVHHSRNSKQKQWDESLVLVLNGMGRLLRSHLPMLVMLPQIDRGWQEIMRVVESTMVSGRKELALAAIHTLSAVLKSQAACDALTAAMWKRAVGVFAAGVQVAATTPEAIPLVARTELVSALESLYNAGPSRFDRDDAEALLGWMCSLMRNPKAASDAASMPGALPPMQKAVLNSMEIIAPQLAPHYPDLCSKLLDQLILLLPQLPSDPWAGAPEERRTALTADQEANQGMAITPLLQERVAGVLVAMYKQHAPWQVRASRFSPLVASLGNCMAQRWQPTDEDGNAPTGVAAGGLWRAAAQAFMAVVNAGVPAINIAYVNSATVDSEPPDEALWDVLYTSFSGYLMGPGEVSAWEAPSGFVDLAGVPSSGPGQPEQSECSEDQLKEDAELEAGVLDALTDGVLTGAVHAPDPSKRRLVELVRQGVTRGLVRPSPSVPTGRKLIASTSGFPHLCLRKLFVLCSRGVESHGAHGTMLEIACLTLPLLLSCCSSILLEFVEDEPLLEIAGRASARDRHELVMCVLEVVSSLKVAPSVVDAAIGDNRKLFALIATCRAGADDQQADSDATETCPDATAAASQQEATHLLLLYPQLVKAIRVRDLRIRETLADVLELVAGELGIPTCPASG